MKSRTIFFLVIVGLMALNGCASIEIALGFRTRLDKIPVTSVSASLSPVPGLASSLAPGKSAQLVITATTDDGKTYVTAGAGHGKVLFDSFTYDASIVKVDKKGNVSLPADPRISEGLMPHIHLSVIGHPNVVTDLDIPVRYDVAFKANFSGRAGSNGSDGFDGTSGIDGSPGSIDPNNPSAGGNGSDGGNGTDGDDGGAGQPGADVHVWITLKSSANPLLQVRATGNHDEQLFLIDPNRGSLSVEANGGRGGSGGSGGRGGSGGSGGSGSPNGSAGNNGSRGFDGHNGADGAAGTIVVSVDPSAEPLLDRLHLANKNGRGVAGPAPEVRIETVPAIW